MKKAIIIMAIILAALLIVAGLLWTGVIGPGEEPPETQPPATEPPLTTEEPTTEPPETSTEPPEPQLTAAQWRYILDGVTLETWQVEGQGPVLIEAGSFLTAAGLDENGKAHASDKARFSYDVDTLTLDGTTTWSEHHEDALYVPLLEVAQAMNYPVWEDTDNSTTYISPSARAFTPAPGINVPVLMYHAVSDNCWGIEELFVSPSDMDAQLAYLVENGYDPIWFEDLAHVEDYDKPVLLTFDDGYDDNYTELFPLLQKHQVKATIFVIANDAAGLHHKMTGEQVRALSDSGLVSIQSHGFTHNQLDTMDEETLEFELGESQRTLCRMTGKIPHVLCYPSGKYSDLTLQVAEKYYNFGIKMSGGLYDTEDDPYLVNRYYIARYTDIYTFGAYIGAAGSEG